MYAPFMSTGDYFLYRPLLPNAQACRERMWSGFQQMQEATDFEGLK